MATYAGPVQDLIDELGRLPGVGPKSAQRIAFHLLKLSKADAMRLAAAILLSRFLGYVGVCLANPVAWTGAAVMLVPAYLAELRRQQNNALARAR